MEGIVELLLEWAGVSMFTGAVFQDNPTREELFRRWNGAFTDDGEQCVVVAVSADENIFIVGSFSQLYESWLEISSKALTSSGGFESVMRIPTRIWAFILPRLDSEKVFRMT